MEINFPTAEVLGNYREFLNGMFIVHKPIIGENLVVFPMAAIGPTCIGKVINYEPVPKTLGEYTVSTDLIKGLRVLVFEGLVDRPKPEPVSFN